MRRRRPRRRSGSTRCLCQALVSCGWRHLCSPGLLLILRTPFGAACDRAERSTRRSRELFPQTRDLVLLFTIVSSVLPSSFFLLLRRVFCYAHHCSALFHCAWDHVFGIGTSTTVYDAFDAVTYFSIPRAILESSPLLLLPPPLLLFHRKSATACDASM